jgi:hypothetical protein
MKASGAQTHFCCTPFFYTISNLLPLSQGRPFEYPMLRMDRRVAVNEVPL